MTAVCKVEKQREDGMYAVVEEFGLVVMKTVDRREAQQYAKFINNGGAFAGATPPFILQQVSVPLSREADDDNGEDEGSSERQHEEEPRGEIVV